MEISDLKRAYTVPQVLTHYGLPQPNRAGFINCLVHTDKNASMKVYPNRLVCFSCGCRMDIFDICGHIHGLDGTGERIKRFHEDMRLDNQPIRKRNTDEHRRLKREEETKQARRACRDRLHRIAYKGKHTAEPFSPMWEKSVTILRNVSAWYEREGIE